MIDQEATSNILTGPQDVDWRICQLRDGLTPWQRAHLRALSYAPGALSAGEWIVRAQRLAHNVMRVEEFVELRDSLLAAGVVADLWPQSGRYYATPLGRRVVTNATPTSSPRSPARHPSRRQRPRQQPDEPGQRAEPDISGPENQRSNSAPTPTVRGAGAYAFVKLAARSIGSWPTWRPGWRPRVGLGERGRDRKPR